MTTNISVNDILKKKCARSKNQVMDDNKSGGRTFYIMYLYASFWMSRQCSIQGISSYAWVRLCSSKYLDIVQCIQIQYFRINIITKITRYFIQQLSYYWVESRSSNEFQILEIVS